MSELNYIVPISNRFISELYTYDLNYPILKGANITLHTGISKVNGFVKSLCKIIDRQSGSIIKKNPK